MTPELESNVNDTSIESTPPPALEPVEREVREREDVGGSGRGRGRIRQDLEEGFERNRQAPQRRRAATAEPAEEEPVEEPIEEGAEPEEAAAPAAPQSQAPEAFSAEAKAEWAKAPKQIQDAILKREQDVAKGVQALRQNYSEIDQALAPRMELIRRHGHSPGQAVNQLFAWFEALSANPREAFPALMNSFRIDPRQIWDFNQAQQQAQPQVQYDPQTGQPIQQGQQPEMVSPATQQYINGLESRLNQLSNAVAQRFGNLESTFQQQSEMKTQEILNQWAQGKEYFEDVRQMMAHLIGSGAVPPLPNGGADLDKAYDMAMYALPDVRGKIAAAKEAKDKADRKAKADAEKAAQQAAAAKARRASGSIGSSAPGSNAPAPADSKRGKTVKDTLREAVEMFNRNA